MKKHSTSMKIILKIKKELIIDTYRKFMDIKIIRLTGENSKRSYSMTLVT